MTAAPRKRAPAKTATKTATKGNQMTDDTKPPEQPPADPDPSTAAPPDSPDETRGEASAAPAGLQFEQLEHCPTPGVCFPYGLPVDASHAACVHGETHAAE